MPIIATNYPDPGDPTAPIPSACAWIARVELNCAAPTYSVQVWVHRSPGAADAVPLVLPADAFSVQAGEELSGEVKMPSLAETVADAFALQQADPSLSPLDALKTVIYRQLVHHPRFAGTNPTQG